MFDIDVKQLADGFGNFFFFNPGAQTISQCCIILSRTA